MPCAAVRIRRCARPTPVSRGSVVVVILYIRIGLVEMERCAVGLNVAGLFEYALRREGSGVKSVRSIVDTTVDVVRW